MADALRTIVLRGAGLEAHVSPLGATLTKLFAPDRTGALADITLGYDTPEPYAKGGTYFGAVVGRCANRIAKGSFTLDGATHALACNNGANALHGGPGGFHSRWWVVEALLGADGAELPPGGTAAEAPAGVRLAYTSPDGEEGYPGELTARVTYALGPHGGLARPALHTTLAATVAGRATLVNLAQHAYWNLGGHDSGDVLAHQLRLCSARYTPVDDSLIPTGHLADVDGTPFDFREPKTIGRDAAAVPGGRGFDHNYVLDGPNALRAASAPPAGLTLAAEARHAESGRVMLLFTDAPGVQLYIGGFLDAEAGKGGAVYPRHGGFCLETQLFPDGANQGAQGFPSPVLRPGEAYTHTMVTQLYAE